MAQTSAAAAAAAAATQLDQNQGNASVPASEPKQVDWSALPEDVFKFMESRTASNSAAYLLPVLQTIKDSNPHLTLLDVGAGAGSISANFAQLIGPEGHVTAVDGNPVVMTRAKIVAEKWGVTNISFQTADAYKLPFEDESFDVVHCHQVLNHNKNQWEIIREMLRVTKPGGAVAVREGDLETEILWPPLPGIIKFHYDLEVKLMTGRGGSATTGRQLLSWALQAGAKRSQITTSFSTWSYTEPEDRKLWASGMVSVALGPAVREHNLKAGITDAEMDEMREGWVEWMERDDAVLTQLMGEIIIRK